MSITMEKQEFLELFEVATRAAKSAGGDKKSPEALRCLDAIKLLKKAPESLACDVLFSTTIGKSFRVFTSHKNRRIRSEGRFLFDLWLRYLYATGSKDLRRAKIQSPVKCAKISKTGDSKRDKVLEILTTSLSKVETEVVEMEMKERLTSCDPSMVAVSVESAMFEKLGCVTGPQKAKYRSILFNLGDKNNPDLRRKVLLGEINGERLVTMKSEEMGSEKIQKEIQEIRERARFKEEDRLKMLQSDMIMT